MSRELDLQALRLLALIEDEGSLGAAGRRLGITQPAASTSLRAFETRWQLRVAERTPRGTRLTADGETVAAWARDLLHQVDTVRGGLQALSARRSQGGSDLGVAASLTVAEFVLPRWIGELRASMPEVHLRLQVQNSDRVDDLVRSGECAIGFVESTRVSEDLARRVVGADRLVIVVPASHPWARRSTPLSREQLLAAEFVVREEGSGTRSTFERALAAQPRIAMVAASTTAMVGAALAGVGPAVVTPYAVRAGLDTGELVEVRHDLDLERPLTAIWRRDRPLDDPAAALLRIACRILAA
ncbi:LysR family transcriptional regulator [Nocardioides hwasunensis]|uniref:LysR family transcriptional regulator n=1 Tax=Nocardioides hwasunensis TaxID=397258 RepID=A0ABR8MDS9_9ACTN|nr:LysR family transcriptional regulator [Nocardioides hwasunensis]MBD3914270.1 LysR family transcriptional regulator [Nocardioides hwasunensis]